MVSHAWTSLNRDDGGLFTLRESRRGRSEAGGWETRCSVDGKSSKIRARSHAKSLPEAPGGIKNRCQEHREQQVGPPRPCWAPIVTLGRAIWAFLGFNLEAWGVILLPRWIVLGRIRPPCCKSPAPRSSILSILQQICRIHEKH